MILPLKDLLDISAGGECMPQPQHVTDLYLKQDDIRGIICPVRLLQGCAVVGAVAVISSHSPKNVVVTQKSKLTVVVDVRLSLRQAVLPLTLTSRVLSSPVSSSYL